MDPVVAFRRFKKTLKQGGQLGFVCRREAACNPFFTVSMCAATNVIPAPEPTLEHVPGPFTLSDADYVSDLLTAAGWSSVIMEAPYHPLNLDVGEIFTAVFSRRLKSGLPQHRLPRVLQVLGRPHARLCSRLWSQCKRKNLTGRLKLIFRLSLPNPNSW